MQIFVLRHGQAEPQQTTDEARKLTPLGRSQVAANVYSALGELKAVKHLWVSPLVRAQQTAAVACDLMREHHIIVTTETSALIVPEANIFSAFDALQAAQLDAVMLVSHQPFVGNFIDVLCGSAPGSHPMNTGALACIDCDLVAADFGKLRWLRQANG